MRRGTNREKSEELIHKIRDIIPGISIRTTLIAGHPGETEKDFQEMYNFVEKIKFNRLGIFTYSHEEDTSAYDLEDDISEKIKKERAEEIMDLQTSISWELNQRKIGKTFKVLFDRIEGGFFIGRTEFDSPNVDNEVLVNVKDNYIRIGDFVNVRIEKADHFDLYGVVVD